MIVVTGVTIGGVNWKLERGGEKTGYQADTARGCKERRETAAVKNGSNERRGNASPGLLSSGLAALVRLLSAGLLSSGSSLWASAPGLLSSSGLLSSVLASSEPLFRLEGANTERLACVRGLSAALRIDPSCLPVTGSSHGVRTTEPNLRRAEIRVPPEEELQRGALQR
jgi:hypothetical protein